MRSSWAQSEGSGATIRCGALLGIDGLLERHGVKTPEFYERAGVDPLALANPDSRMNVCHYMEILEAAAERSRDDALGLRLGYQQPLSTVGALFEMCLEAPDVCTAIQTFNNHFPMHMEGARLDLKIDGRYAFLSYSVHDPNLLDYRQDAELSVAKILRFARRLVRQTDWAPIAAHFEHPTPRNAARHRQLFGAPVYFSQPYNGITFPKELLSRRIDTGDQHRQTVPVVSTIASGIESSHDLVSKLRVYIAKSLRRGHGSIDEYAAAFGLTTRTLQRRLAKRGVIFEEHVDSIRYDLAKHYLKQVHLSVTEISYLLGYAELSTFSRAFRRWSGMSPLAFRRGQ